MLKQVSVFGPIFLGHPIIVGRKKRGYSWNKQVTNFISGFAVPTHKVESKHHHNLGFYYLLMA